MVMMGANKAIFVDTNALIRLHVTTAPDHQVVEAALKQLVSMGIELWINRQVMREYATVLTRPQSYASPANPSDVSKQLYQFETTYKIADETIDVSANLRKLMETISIGGKQIHDANIVATMQAYEISMLFTLNIVDFTRFVPLIQIITPQEVLSPHFKI